MEEKKGTDLKVFFLVLVLVVLAAVVSYVYLYRPLADERAALWKENFELNSRLIELQNMKTEHEEDFIKGIEESQKTMQTKLNHYSAGNTPEKSIMMANRMETEVGLKFPNLSFSQPELLTNVKMPIVSTNEDGTFSFADYDVSLLRETLSMNYTCSYEQLKKLIDFVNAYPERMNINSITISYDSENHGLLGSMTLNLYAVTGTGKEYVAPDISGLSLGQGNIFSGSK